MPSSVFISYGHGDMKPTDWLDKLNLYFAPMRLRKSIELFFFDNFEKLTVLERFEFDQIRALTDDLQTANSRSLAVVTENPELLSMVPRAQKLKQHLNFWLNKYDRVFLKTPQMCVLYTGVEDAVPFPASIDREIEDWLRTQQGV